MDDQIAHVRGAVVHQLVVIVVDLLQDGEEVEAQADGQIGAGSEEASPHPQDG